MWPSHSKKCLGWNEVAIWTRRNNTNTMAKYKRMMKTISTNSKNPDERREQVVYTCEWTKRILNWTKLDYSSLSNELAHRWLQLKLVSRMCLFSYASLPKEFQDSITKGKRERERNKKRERERERETKQCVCMCKENIQWAFFLVFASLVRCLHKQ